MKTKNLISAALLVFVAASVVALVVKQSWQAPPSGGNTPEQPVAGKRVIAYYLHGNVRCETCRTIESHAQEAVQTGFPEPVQEGRLQWRVVNYDQPENAHFAEDYQVVAPSLVLVLMDGSEQLRWENLPEVWPLVGDKPAFLQYVREHVQTFLKETEGPEAGSATGRAGPAATSPSETPGGEASPKSGDQAASTAGIPRLVDLGAGKCIPCKMMAPILVELREEYQGKMEVLFLDVWETPELANQYGIEIIPTQIFYGPSGKELYRHEGFFSKEDILKKWEEMGIHLQKDTPS